ncbi:hypothetical protein AUK40_01325 [Candidatus Wirthbacteria bacterium CG2_30_54_11]|uniref:Helix-turn-helix domain-containing protein n=1 Tax=Candidatus Wirthbacteria bacterium CG2_30_54_11 TaxID=1817892 RepID=A0A1J5IN71_9BACT|nr:MAG: hypothetical protein AUK40_01325 [Candidatus Wirthbacteria bacterium CG2_30_54_11]
MPEILSPEQTATYLQLNIRSVYQALNNGGIPGRRIGNRWRISRRILDAWMAGDEIFEEFLLERLFKDEIVSAQSDHQNGQGVSLDAYLSR